MIYWQDIIKFIRTVSRLNLDPEQRRSIMQFLDQDLPWEQIMLLAQAQGVDSLLYHHLCHLKGAKIPESAWTLLEDSYRKHKNRQSRIEHEAELISLQLERNGLTAIALQGLSVFQSYKFPGLRPMGDMDIMVKVDQRDRVVALLHEIGFRISNSSYPNLFFKDVLWLDLHTHILNIDRIESRKYVFPEDLSPLWDRACPVFKSSGGLLKPDPADNFILLAAHTLKHAYSRMIWLVDLNISLTELITTPSKWDRLVPCAKSWQQEKTVLYALTMLEGMLKQQMPFEVKKELGYQRLGTLEKYVLRLKIEGIEFTGYHIILWFFSITGMKRKLKFLKETMLPANQIMAQIYQESTANSRFLQSMDRIVQSLFMIGNAIKQALSYRLFSSGF
ncbi:MAG: nucleotidyltransferase family protein [Deltaproteobacteria bacterium]|nr:nucleotidyltransferase family protein [Deltaproteobacteria bacterium]MBW2151155.1 nucleotidyltransferase family protein [Deltaproteobacteria bacterium]